MISQRSLYWLLGSAALSASVAYCVQVLYGCASRRWSEKLLKKVRLPDRLIVLVETEAQWIAVSSRLLAVASKEKVVGFDCEWANRNGKAGRVALLQLTATDGLCVLIRMNKMAEAATNSQLMDLLADKRIVKVGVAPHYDAIKLMADYGLLVHSYLDLGWLAKTVIGNPLPNCGLKSLAKHVLDVELDKSWTIRCGDWEADVLSERQIEYAAMDALVSVEIFLTLIGRFVDGQWTLDHVKVWLDRPYKHKYRLKEEANIKNGDSTAPKTNKTKNYSHLVRKSPLYHNCVLLAPDGQALCTCDVKKINWYLERNLAVKISSEPIVARLKFEPTRTRTAVDEEFYLAAKDNCCVVCGAVDSYIRKNVVPLEYRRHLPSPMKDHRCHDIVLMCTNCHRQSSEFYVVLQRQLAERCDAPLAHLTNSSIENPEAKRVKSAAKALSAINAFMIPESRRRELQAIVCDHFEESDISPELLLDALNLETKSVNDPSTSHGFKVVRKMAETEGLLALERMWRKHFLDTMKPKFLPKLWSVDHGHDTLRSRTAEGTDEWLALFGSQTQATSSESFS